MINQQADLAADSGQGVVLSRVIEESNRVMRQVQTSWMRLLDTEFRKQVDKPAEVAPGLVEYVMALANDQVKSADFTEALLGRIEPIVSDKYRAPISEHLNDAMDGFLNVAKKCVQVLIDVAFNDIKGPVRTLFTAAWYTDDPMQQIVATVRDYMDDYHAHLNPSLFDLLLEDIIDTFLIAYLAAMRKASKLRVPGARDKIRADVQSAVAFFRAFKPASELQNYFEPVEAAMKLLTASKAMFFLVRRRSVGLG